MTYIYIYLFISATDDLSPSPLPLSPPPSTPLFHIRAKVLHWKTVIRDLLFHTVPSARLLGLSDSFIQLGTWVWPFSFIYLHISHQQGEVEGEAQAERGGGQAGRG